jgi:hypothetical protein
MKRLATVFAAVALLSGCALMPDSQSTGWTHVSHPLLGPPFGPGNEEATLDTIDTRVEWQRGRYRIEASLGYRVTDGGFYGDDFIFMGRVGYQLWSK